VSKVSKHQHSHLTGLYFDEYDDYNANTKLEHKLLFHPFKFNITRTILNMDDEHLMNLTFTLLFGILNSVFIFFEKQNVKSRSQQAFDTVFCVLPSSSR
jgi:hypothetical protein